MVASLRRFFQARGISGREIVFFIIIALLFFANRVYVAYPDEFVNLLGGQYILRGLLPYRDFFDHHLPFAWYFSALIMIFTGKSFVAFRSVWALLQFFSLLFLGLWIKKRNRHLYPYFLVFFALFPLAALYFWFHLYLGDSLAVLFFSLAFWIILVESLENRIDFKALIVSSLLIAAMVFSSLTFIYLALVLYLWQLYLLRFRLNKQTLIFCLISAAPYVFYLLFLLVTGTFKDFYFANFSYNTQLYIDIPNYTRGRFFNPLKFGLTLIFNFYTHYLTLLTKTKYFDLYLPINVLAGISTFVLFLLLWRKNWVLGLLFFFVLSFSAPRSTVEVYSETDYQSAVFLGLGLISSLLVLYLLKKIDSEDNVVSDLMKLARAIIAIFLLFTIVFLAANFYNKHYLIYTQKLPSINDQGYSAQFVDGLVNKDDYYWIGPYEPDQLFYVRQGVLPGKYISLLPQFKENDYTRNTFLQQFIDHPPKLIIYRQSASIFMTPALKFGDFFLNWMSDKYTSIENIPGIEVLRSPSSFNLQTDLYLRNSDREELLAKLQQQGFIVLTRK